MLLFTVTFVHRMSASHPSTQGPILVRMLRIREWERQNLPIYATSAGYALFLKLASLPPTGSTSLKQMYLSMPCAESTTRLLFRNLEQDGMIYLPRDQADQRFREFKLTPKFQTVIANWEEFIESVWSE